MTPQHLVDYIEEVQQSLLVSVDNIQWHLTQFKDIELQWCKAEIASTFLDFLEKLDNTKNELSRKNQ